ncbi:TIMELESS domain-containing protein [Psidium guajava]|nr:TIMELESS domain-containing protein [Psidium guajava]
MKPHFVTRQNREEGRRDCNCRACELSIPCLSKLKSKLQFLLIPMGGLSNIYERSAPLTYEHIARKNIFNFARNKTIDFDEKTLIYISKIYYKYISMPSYLMFLF